MGAPLTRPYFQLRKQIAVSPKEESPLIREAWGYFLNNENSWQPHLFSNELKMWITSVEFYINIAHRSVSHGKGKYSMESPQTASRKYTNSMYVLALEEVALRKVFFSFLNLGLFTLVFSHAIHRLTSERECFSLMAVIIKHKVWAGVKFLIQV